MYIKISTDWNKTIKYDRDCIDFIRFQNQVSKLDRANAKQHRETQLKWADLKNDWSTFDDSTCLMRFKLHES